MTTKNPAVNDPPPRLSTLFFFSLLGLFAFDLLGIGRNFSKAHRFLRRGITAERTYPEEVIAGVCQAVNLASIWYPKQVRCLQRSMVTTTLLRRYGVPAHMAVGAQNVPFKAHAWTEVNGKAINERNDVQKIYSVWERC
ncbi:MAG TPA: lasso peptide biosynthesis B2 protein [Terriglobales bacterium]|nr:lasso peptide biosynthesis B2 protein [Terriglobales bacterium]